MDYESIMMSILLDTGKKSDILEYYEQKYNDIMSWDQKNMKSESEVAQSCLTLSDPMDCSLPGSSIHGIFQARVLEWGAIAKSAYA